jgi:hypothetical protein
MPRGLAWLLAIAAIGSAWWLAGHPGYSSREQKYQREQISKNAQSAPKLYRWKDANGVTQITQTPPKSGKYTVISIRDDQNIIESAAPASEAPQ